MAILFAISTYLCRAILLWLVRLGAVVCGGFYLSGSLSPCISRVWCTRVYFDHQDLSTWSQRHQCQCCHCPLCLAPMTVSLSLRIIRAIFPQDLLILPIFEQYHNTVISPSVIVARSKARTSPTQKTAPSLRSSGGHIHVQLAQLHLACMTALNLEGQI